MSFLKKIFRSSKKAAPKSPPSRVLKLGHEVTKENAAKFAQQFVDAVNENESIELNYRQDSLDFVDTFLGRFKKEGLTANQFAETIFVAGCYVGQVMITNIKGEWVDESDVAVPGKAKLTKIIVKLSNGHIADPIAKAFKRFHFGESESLSYFYEIFAKAK